MGRRWTGAWTTGEAKRIEMSYLIEKGLLKRGQMVSGTLSWSNKNTGESKGSISYLIDLTSRESYIRLSYETTYRDTGLKKSFDNKIDIVAVPSNLGMGEVLYFICPSTGQKCRILYKAYNSDTWKSREAYSRRIYYDLQQCSKLDRYNTKYWLLDGQLFNRKRKRVNATYKGKKTKTSIRNENKWNEMMRMDQMRWSPAGMPKSMWPYAKEMGYY